MKKYLKSYFDFKKINDDILFLLKCNVQERPKNGIDTVKEFYADFRTTFENMPVSTHAIHDFFNQDIEIVNIKNFIKNNSVMDIKPQADESYEVSTSSSENHIL